MTSPDNRRGNETFGDERRGGPQRKDTCKNGHDLDKYGFQLYTKDGRKNGRDCTICRKDRGRQWHRDNYPILKIRRAVRELERESEIQLRSIQQESKDAQGPEVSGTG